MTSLFLFVLPDASCPGVKHDRRKQEGDGRQDSEVQDRLRTALERKTCLHYTYLKLLRLPGGYILFVSC